jgi:ABC-2 type transport system permease protein
VTAGALTGVVRSEWVKLRSLRSTVAGYAAIGVVLVALYGIFLTLPAGTSGDPAFTALLVAELLVAGVAVLATAGEYSAGTARSTFTAVPRRTRVLTAKLVAHACVLLVLTALAAAVGWTSAAVAVPEAAGSPLDPVVLRAGLGTALALGCVVVLGMSAGLLTRSPAAGLTAAFLVLVVPVVVVTAPEVTAYLPGRAVVALVLAPRPAEAHLLPTWTAALVLGAWSAGSAVVAAAALRHRDV